jgi:2OG-Fe(II) oxygenase superfamily
MGEMAAEGRSDGVLVRPGFADESDIAALLSAFDAALAAQANGRDPTNTRLLAVRTEVPCRRIALVCTPEIAARVSSIRDRIVTAIKQFFDRPEQWPELTLLSEMRATDSHPLHADAEQLTAGRWVPNHTHWRSYVGLLYLNTSTVDYHGGLLRLPQLERTIAPTAGMLVSFPTGRRHIHEVTAITAGRRLSLAIWLTADRSRAEPWLTADRSRAKPSITPRKGVNHG